MAKYPDTMEDWAYYASSIPSDEIVSKANAVNTLGFVKDLIDDGYEPEEIEHILSLFAKRLNALDKLVPDGGAGFYTSYKALLPEDD